MTRGKRAYEDVEDTNDVQEWSGRERRSHRGVRVLPKKTKVSLTPRPHTAQIANSSSNSGAPSPPTNLPHLQDECDDVSVSEGDDNFPYEWMGRQAFARRKGKVW